MDRNFEFDELKSAESKLRNQILTNYAPDLRPVQDTNTITYVNITLNNIQVMNLVRY